MENLEIIEKIEELKKKTEEWELNVYRNNDMEEYDKAWYKGYYKALKDIKEKIQE